MTYCEDLLEVASLPLPWSQLNDCSILITGATGLIGSCLVDVLMMHSGRNYQIYAAGRNEERARNLFANYWDDAAFHFVPYDVMCPVCSDVSFHYIIHAASNASPNFFVQHPVEVMKANLMGVCHLMDYGLLHDLRRFLYVSTGEVYGEGDGDGRTFTEEYSGYVNTMSPRSCYPSSKRAAETLCVAYAEEYGVDAVVARLSHVYGPHFTESDNRVYAQFIRNVLQNQNIVMKSTGEQFRSWCYVVDAVKGLLYILLKGASGCAYNVADASSNISIRQLAEMVADIGGSKVVVNAPAGDERKGYNPVTQSVYSTKRLEELGWKVMGTMREKMEATIRECRTRRGTLSVGASVEKMGATSA